MNVLANMSNRVARNVMTTLKSIRIAVIDDHAVFRRSLVRMLKGVDGIEVVGEGRTSADALKVAKELVPDVMLLDLRLPGGGTEAVASISRVCPSVRTVVLTDSENERDIALAVQAGARGYIMTSTSGREVVETVRAVSRGGSRAAPRLAPRLLITNGERIKTIANDSLRDLDFREE